MNEKISLTLMMPGPFRCEEIVSNLVVIIFDFVLLCSSPTTKVVDYNVDDMESFLFSVRCSW